MGSIVGTGGDLARRIALRRRDLGMSVEELARSASVEPAYLRYFEEHADARLSVGTLSLIADALETSPVALLGGDIDRPLGRGRAVKGSVLKPLTPTQCRAYLEAGGVGRVLFAADRGPVALPVNYRFSGGAVIFKTTVVNASKLEGQEIVGFEIDRIDSSMREGWSVMVSGLARRVDAPEELLEYDQLELEAWAGGGREVVVVLKPTEVTGRIIIRDTPTG